MKRAKRILCFGDSNTYGYDYRTHDRYDAHTRWTGILADKLGDGYCVLECGKNNRTTVYNYGGDPAYNGSEILPTILKENYPVDYIVVMLGSNDCKTEFSATPEIVGMGLEIIVDLIKLFDNRTSVILVSPPLITGTILQDGNFSGSFGRSSISVSAALPAVIEKIAAVKDCRYLSCEGLVTTENADGLHLAPEGHRQLAEALEKLIRSAEAEPIQQV